MPSELENLLRDHAGRLDAEMVPISAVEAIDRSAGLSAVSPRDVHRTRRWRPLVSVAAVLSVLAGAGFLATRLGDDDARIITPATVDVPETPPGVFPSTDPVATTSTTTIATSTVPPISTEITAEQVQLAQRDALMNLTGFSATASTTSTDAPDELDDSDSVRYTLLADGSLYVDTGPGTFGSFDPTTGTVLGAFRDDAGQLSYQEITGQTDNGLPLTILGGFDPTRLIDASPFEQQTIREVEADGRTAWEVTTVQEYEVDDFSSAPFDTDFTQTTTQIVDRESGLIVSTAESSTQPTSGGDRRTVLSDITVVATMPPEFPGTFPDGADVDRSGSTPRVTGATVDDVAELFGIAVPIPSGLVDGTAVAGGSPEIVLVDRPQFDEGDADSEPRTTYREARFTVRRGFVSTTVQISSVALRAGADVPAGLAVSEGYLCFDPDGDGVCNSGGDPQGFNDGTDLVPIDAGLFAGLTLELFPPEAALTSGSVQYGPFAVGVFQSERAEIAEIVRTFELISPGT